MNKILLLAMIALSTGEAYATCSAYSQDACTRVCGGGCHPCGSSSSNVGYGWYGGATACPTAIHVNLTPPTPVLGTTGSKAITNTATSTK